MHQDTLTQLEDKEDSLNRDEQRHLELLRDWELECRDYNEVLKKLALESQLKEINLKGEVNLIKENLIKVNLIKENQKNLERNLKKLKEHLNNL